MPERMRRFNFAGFILFISVQALLLFRGIIFFFPNMWRQQLEAGPIRILTTFFACGLFACFAEFFFHRYVLHTVTIFGARAFSQKHGTHHQLTLIVLEPSSSGDEHLVNSRYPIVRTLQWESAIFPGYAFVLVAAVVAPMLGMLQWLFPHVPFILSGYLAFTCSLVFYEVSHAIDHMPYDWWRGKVEHPRFGRFWRREYGFHMVHHYDTMCNQNVFGFCFIALADRVLGTYRAADPLLLDKNTVSLKDISPYRPCRLIAWLDRIALKREKNLMDRTRIR